MSTTAVVKPRALDYVRSQAWAHGLEISEDEADTILWNYTGFPEFWPRGFVRPLDALRFQLRHYFDLREQGFNPCARCGGYARDWLCPRCDEAMRR